MHIVLFDKAINIEIYDAGYIFSYLHVGKCTLTCSSNHLIMAVNIKCSISFEICYQRGVFKR